MYKIRVILDTKEDVIRTISFNEKQSLEKLHYAIANAFGFNGLEMASFYRTDNEWNQGEEIPLFNMEDEESINMNSCILNETLFKENDKLIYVYDFLNMWTFFVEVIEITNEKITEPKVILSVGEVPSEAPNKEFKAISNNGFEDEFSSEFDDYNDFDSYDDFDNY
ncbi:MAG: hypothetical protein KGV59_00355 [Tenacibaculum sp.]|nr:hypothetical protein [Tenacibaculum sp.]